MDEVSPWVFAAASSAVTAGGAWLINFLKVRQQHRIEDRRDALAEWREIANGQQVQLSQLQKQVYELLLSHAQCEKQNAELRGEVQLLQLKVQQLQQLHGPVPAVESVIVVPKSGV